MAIDDGGPAFGRAAHLDPNGPDGYWSTHPHDSMSLRDWFAGHAMRALAHDILIDQHWEDVLKSEGVKPDEFPAFLAHLAYVSADAMLAERAKGGTA